jgi:hypothetical protein
MVYLNYLSNSPTESELSMYNGFESQDAFHAWMREEWRRMLSTPEAVDAHNAAYTSGHAGCDHAEGYCSHN